MVAAALVVVLVAGACSGDDDSDNGAGSTGRTTTTSTTSADAKKDWSPADVARARNLALRLQRVTPGDCADVQLLPRAAYLVVARRLDLEPAAAAANCEMYGEVVELTVYASNAARDAYVKARTLALCKSADRAKANLPALHWVVGTRFSVQFQREGPARNVADALDAQYRLEKCPGEGDVTWSEAGEARIAQLVEQLQARPEIKCSPNVLQDFPEFENDQRYKDRLPAAFSQCAGRGNTVIYIAAFDPGGDVTPRAFIDGETKILCGHDIAAVEGDDFAVIATNVRIAALAAVATGGTALPPAC
jgi:hypothetical protein